MNISSLLRRSSKPVLRRIEEDLDTKLRLRYTPYYHAIDRVEGPWVWVEGRRMLMMSSNEYLGLSQHPRVIEAARRALQQWGTSPCGSRLANGSRKYHEELEEALASFLGKEACHVIVAGYLACQGSLAALARRGDLLLLDRSIHASLWDGALLGGCQIERFSHRELASLKEMLAAIPQDRPKIMAVDGVYSMEGHLAPLPELVCLGKTHGIFLVVDDAHGLGVFGREGRGVCDHFGLTQEVDLIVGSFSKSLASTGGFFAGSRGVIEYLRSHCRQIIFSAAVTPACAAAALEALEILQQEPEHREKLWENTRYYHRILKEAGFDFWESSSPAVPVVVGNREKCYFVWKSLWEEGFFTVLSIAPGVPPGRDLIRTAISSFHTPALLDSFVEALQRAFRKARVPLPSSCISSG
ncbi:aminotransferase class I/II-fold pyridoxal phosphate-dependent enzyme [Candidatus Methylacidithermus pantelleriae]|uniref:8-amino-7-oxononanoate synthase n=1 Tax=Candidatus Methylacidithermus pantelleriae TaxID=2744239 RepID=A0A8J2BMF7_9BACT|nr:aminotransferase class I/II-fold pyridoxal phosphate-dependent enzyme [Candidatus Methylacidithermus pantelleriae]CAF0689637.1 8-amino-7-oxononanoate synthase [Candidatus Methylacidithermus pantelleriae]